MADKNRDNEQINDDILRCREDVLRARDIMPPYSSAAGKKETDKERKSQKPDEDTSKSAQAAKASSEKTAGKDTSPIPIETTAQKRTAPSTAKREEAEMPRFDLAEEIMAEQRRITSIRRKAPGKKSEAEVRREQVEPVSYALEQPMPEESEQNRPFDSFDFTQDKYAQDRLIAEIVARDIRRLCGGKI